MFTCMEGFIFWNITSYNPVRVNRCFEGTFCLRNIFWYITPRNPVKSIYFSDEYFASVTSSEIYV
jgi:hypothetical protein